MQCPDDMNESEFQYVLDSVPKSFKLLATKREKWWRVFTFRVTKNVGDFRKGDIFETSGVCKLTQWSTYRKRPYAPGEPRPSK